MDAYYHSVMLDKKKCVGCTNCLMRCPTEAIRIRGGRARILDQRCIDCGECIRACHHHAKIAVTNPLSAINRYPYKIALPAPTLYGQFKRLSSVGAVVRGLRQMGFDEVYEVARGADMTTAAIRKRMGEADCPKPLISSACPAVVRLIQIRFPELIDNIVDVKSPMEIAAIDARRKFCAANNVAPEDVGCFFITPCPAKMTAVRKPLGHATSDVNGAISIMEIYGLLSGQIRKLSEVPNETEHETTALGVGWACSGGESMATGAEDALAVDGIQNVIRVLEAIENNQLPELKFFEGLACTGGCVGGPLVFENEYIARNRIKKLVESMPKKTPDDAAVKSAVENLGGDIYFESNIQELKVLQLDSDVRAALAKMNRVEEIRKRLPQLNCGSCGSPTCLALAEDIVEGYAHEMDCLFLLKDKVRQMAQQMIELSDERL